jgi:hypothetical protein
MLAIRRLVQPCPQSAIEVRVKREPSIGVRFRPRRTQVRIRADLNFTKWDVEITAPPAFSRTHKLAPLFGLIFRRSSCQHPVLAGALGDERDPALHPSGSSNLIPSCASVTSLGRLLWCVVHFSLVILACLRDGCFGCALGSPAWAWWACVCHAAFLRRVLLRLFRQDSGGPPGVRSHLTGGRRHPAAHPHGPL